MKKVYARVYLSNMGFLPPLLFIWTIQAKNQVEGTGNFGALVLGLL